MLQRTSEIVRLLVRLMVFENQEHEKQVVDKLMTMGFGAGVLTELENASSRAASQLS